MPSLAIIANNIDESSSIGSMSAWDAAEALKRGWDVLGVCEQLDRSLAGAVRHLPLYVPPRLHLVQYAAGRRTARTALLGHEPDVVVTHQPQSAAIADVWNVHYLEHAARDVRAPLQPGWKPRLADLMSAAVTRLEDRWLQSLPGTSRVVFCSNAVRDDFIRLYGAPPDFTVIPNPALTAPNPVTGPDREQRALVTEAHPGPVLGFLGGGDPRKGGDRLLAAVAREPDLFALLAGPGRVGTGAGRTRELGQLNDVRQLLDIVDALVVPSRFEPFGLVVVEAAARGVPVIVTAEVGSSSLVVEHGAGVLWDGVSPLTPIVREVVDRRGHYRDGGLSLVKALDRDSLADRRFAEYDAVFARKRRG